MKSLVSISLVALTLTAYAVTAPPSQAAVVHRSVVSPVRALKPLPQNPFAWYTDFGNGLIYVDGHWYPICCVPDPQYDDVIAVRVQNSFSIAQFIDAGNQQILQFNEATHQVARFASVQGINGVALDTRSANTYALTPTSLQQFTPNGHLVRKARMPVPNESLNVAATDTGDMIGLYGQGYFSLYNAQSLTRVGSLQLPPNTFPAGAKVRVTGAGGQWYLHADGDFHMIGINPHQIPWILSSVTLPVQNPMGLGADAIGLLYVSLNGQLVAFTPDGKPAQSPLNGQPATPDFSIGH
ncbi:MAG: hypothetical protein JO043_04430 [Candidatus Eremiobacteraeota bacterium]|nr:hypothetical protein [Candidatus Eremiobacteraeota bacterium]